METSNANDEKKFSKILSVLVKTLGVFMLLFFHCLSSQIYVTGGAIIHYESDVVIFENNADQVSKTKIYISSGTAVSDFSSTNIETVEHIKQSTSQRKKSLATSKPKINKLKEEVKIIVEKPKKQTVDYFYSDSDQDVLFSIFSKANAKVVPIQNLPIKVLISASDYSASPLYFDFTQDISTYSDQFFKSQSKDYSYFLRPPPFSI